MSTCARCGLAESDKSPSDATASGLLCFDAVTSGTGAHDWAALACRDRQIYAQAALLRSVTGKLESALEIVHHRGLAAAEQCIRDVLELLS